jgi:hypothetical protein
MGAPDSPMRHRTGPVDCPVRCHVTQPLGFGSSRLLASLYSCGTGQFGAAPDRSCSLFGAPLTLRALFFTVHLSQRLLQSTVARSSRCSPGTPDSPVIFSGVCLEKPESGWFELDGPCRPNTVQWHTGQSGAPFLSTLGFFCSFEFDP